MKIIKATSKEFEKLRDLRKEFYLDQVRKYDLYALEKWADKGMPQALAKELRSKNCAYFIAEDNGNLIGYSACEIKKLPAWYKIKNKGHLFNIYVKKEHRNRGIAKKLIRQSIYWLKGKNVPLLEIMFYDKNKSINKFYSRLGFVPYTHTVNLRLQ